MKGDKTRILFKCSGCGSKLSFSYVEKRPRCLECDIKSINYKLTKKGVSTRIFDPRLNQF
jgi:DNA-directed RNA polymerase subunit RPC12/RpoP